MIKINNIFKLCTNSVHICVITLLFTTISFAQVTTEIDTTKIRIGEQITLKYIVDKQDNIQFPKLELDSLKKIEVIKSHDIDTLKEKLIKKYTLTSFDSGRYALPQQLIKIKSKQYKTDSIWINVSTVATDTIKQPLFPIKAIQHQKLTLKDYAKNYWIWILASLLIIGIILYFLLRKKETEEERAAKIPPFEMAVQQLENLDKKLLWQNNKTKQYYSELTDIIRTYIEKELKIAALESTTNELIRELKKFNNINNLDISNKVIIRLKTLLKEADLVKFAKSKPFAEEIETHRNYAGFVLEGLKIEGIEEIEEVEIEKIEAEETKLSEEKIVEKPKTENDAE